MKRLFNISSSPFDLERFENKEALRTLLEGFDGLELLTCGEDSRGILSREMVLGLHLNCPAAWLDFWQGNEDNLRAEFGTPARWQAHYGGGDRQALLAHYKEELALAHDWGAEYVVFHVADTLTEDFFRQSYRHRDEDVIDAACELLNGLFAEEDGSLALLMENLWHPGLRFTDPAMTARLWAGVRYANKGFLLDTGHLMHCRNDLSSEEEALAYIHRMLDAHEAFLPHIRGVHLHQSLTGAYAEAVKKAPPRLPDDPEARQAMAYEHAFAVDRHRPFLHPGVKALIERIAPQWLTFELITESLEQHRQFLAAQAAVFDS